MKFEKCNRYDKEFLNKNMMGPNSMRIIEEITNHLPLENGMRIMDLGCGKGLTSIFLAEELKVNVFATDLWIEATENNLRFCSLGLGDSIIPIHAEANALPYADDFFDAVISVDAFHYFGAEEDYLSKNVIPLVKPGGYIAVAVPGLKREFDNGIPEEMKPFWTEDMNFHSVSWWTELWSRSRDIEIIDAFEMECYDEAWRDWLACDNEYAKGDIPMLEADGGRYFNLVCIIAKKKA